MKKQYLARRFDLVSLALLAALALQPALARAQECADPLRTVGAASAADATTPAAPAPKARAAKAAPVAKKVVRLVFEGAGDVMERFYIPAINELKQDLKGEYEIQAVFADYSNPNEDKFAREKRLRIKKFIQQSGWTYLDKRLLDDNVKYLQLENVDYVVLGVPGRFHKPLKDFWTAKKNPPRVFGEKPISDSVAGARELLYSLRAYDPRMLGIDHYRPKLAKSEGEVDRDEAFLGGQITHVEFVLAENRSGSDAGAALKTDNGRDGAIEREGREQVMGDGVAADLLPHMLAVLQFYGTPSTVRPVDVFAGRYRGVDGDPNKETLIPRETFFASNFVFTDRHGNHVTGETIVGKGLRVRKYGPEYENNCKLFILHGVNGAKIVHDLRSSGNGASMGHYYNPDGTEAYTDPLEPKPYKALLRGMITGQSLENHHSVPIEEAVAFRERIEEFTRFVGRNQKIPVYDGGMGGKNFRLAPYAEDLIASLPAALTPDQPATPAPAKPAVVADRDWLMIGGLGVMGKGFSHRIADVGGYKLVIQDPNPKRDEILAGFDGKGDVLTTDYDLAWAVSTLKRPRKVMLLVATNAIFERQIAALSNLLEPGDIIIDGGNSNWKQTEELQKKLGEKGIYFIGMGVSGGERGAWNGSSMMAGGPKTAWEQVRPVLESIAAPVQSLTQPGTQVPSVAWVGPGGAGHFVKMSHNGIEYVEMQVLADLYAVMRDLLGMSTAEIQRELAAWNETDLQSFLLGATAKILTQIDPKTGNPLVEMVKPEVKQKGTGKWATENALDLGVYAPALSDAVFTRFASTLTASRARVRGLAGPRRARLSKAEKERILAQLPQALRAARYLDFAQGLQLIQVASKTYFQNQVDLAAVTNIWRSGSILQGRMLDELHLQFVAHPRVQSILNLDVVKRQLSQNTGALLDTVQLANASGIPVPALQSLLTYYHTVRMPRTGSPSNLLALLRDYFGGHMFERIDEPGQMVHFDWPDAP